MMLDYADPVQLELTKEVSLKFGKEKSQQALQIFCFWNRKRSC